MDVVELGPGGRRHLGRQMMCAAPSTSTSTSSGGGVSIYSPSAITLAVGGVSLEITSSGFTLSGGPVMSAQTGTFAGVIVDMHLHSGVTTGSDETGPPVAGT